MNVIKYSLATAAIVVLFASPAIAQDATTPTAPNATTAPTTGGGQSGGTSGTDPQNPLNDVEVFGYELTVDPATLSPEQLTAARNTCNQDVTANPMRYSPAVKDFCAAIR